MWTNENRGRYDRRRLRYPSDLTDDEWNLVEPLIPPGTVIMREVVNGLMYICRPAVSGGPSRRTCRRVRHCTIISTCGVGMARSISSIMHSM